ncbi:MAG: hypothetical protein AVO33_10050 [delta proteobacterium ML8_F1]|nr:MAG: hypothetical protein AVO33_10050 [delta proteobacterium ML8_F1]
MFNRRMWIALAAGAVLGVVCIIGAQIRSAGELQGSYLFAFWFNRLLMGAVIGLAGEKQDFARVLVRGGVLGLMVSFSFFSASGFGDFPGFLVGVPYGLMIEAAAYPYRRDHEKTSQRP